MASRRYNEAMAYIATYCAKHASDAILFEFEYNDVAPITVGEFYQIETDCEKDLTTEISDNKKLYRIAIKATRSHLLGYTIHLLAQGQDENEAVANAKAYVRFSDPSDLNLCIMSVWEIAFGDLHVVIMASYDDPQ